MKSTDVYVVTDSGSEHSRRILMGVLAHSRALRRPWRVRWGEWSSYVSEGRIDGVILPVRTEQFAALIREMRFPAVNVSTFGEGWGIPSVVPDNRLIGRMAGEFLLGRLYPSFAFVGATAQRFCVEREEGFRQALEGRNCVQIESIGGNISAGIFRRRIRELPRGTAVFCGNDYFARQVMEAADFLERSVPGDLAVLGVDVEDSISAALGFRLSSIDPNSELIGRRAAEALEGWMSTGRSPYELERIPPAQVVEHDSTGLSHESDEQVARALRLIREEACLGLHVEDVARMAGIGRRSLEKRFQTQLGQTIHEAIRRRRLDRACELLRTTTLRIAEIAERSGFSDLYYFSAAFKRVMGASPEKWRTSARSHV